MWLRACGGVGPFRPHALGISSFFVSGRVWGEIEYVIPRPTAYRAGAWTHGHAKLPFVTVTVTVEPSSDSDTPIRLG